MAAAGVKLIAASDAYTARDVGRWQYLDELPPRWPTRR